MNVTTEDWNAVDWLWESYRSNGDTLPVGVEQNIDSNWGATNWLELDAWWESATENQEIFLIDKVFRILDQIWGANDWEIVDDWWKPYAEHQQKQSLTLVAVFEALNDAWKQSPSRYDVDPLTADWSVRGTVKGPLRITHEEDWSHWLAQLIRTSSGAFTKHLIDESFDENAQVYREEPLHNPDGKNRRVDILVHQGSIGLSIEVKHQDTNLAKTLPTVELIERHFPQKWIHCLLIPKFNAGFLEQAFPDQLQKADDGKTVIRLNETANIQVLYWEDVTQALRRTLLLNEEPSPHWESSAYLFISMVEQYMLSFRPISPYSLRTTDPEDVALSELTMLMNSDIDAQIAHLRQAIDINYE